MSPNAIKKAVSAAWHALETAAYKHIGGSDVDSLLRQSTDAEREHRAFGKRFTNGQCGYRVPVGTAAELIALHNVYEGLVSRQKRGVLECGSVRQDVVTAWYVAERLKLKLDKKQRADLRKALKPVLDIDYAKDCAKP